MLFASGLRNQVPTIFLDVFADRAGQLVGCRIEQPRLLVFGLADELG